MHQRGEFPGWSIRAYASQIGGLVRRTRAQTLLDYGCGEGKQYSVEGVHHGWGVMPHLYEPARPEFALRPDGVFDGVICTDVLEHVPEAEVENVCRELGLYARRFLFVSICNRPAKRILPDGRNCHVTLMPRDRWQQLLQPHCLPGCELVVVETP